MAPGSASLLSCVVVSPVYCSHERTVLTLKETLWSGTGDEICITDQEGSVWFKVDPKLAYSKEERIVYDIDGLSVFSLKKKSWSVHQTWRLFRGGAFDKQSMLCDIKMGLLARCDWFPGLENMSGTKIKIFLNDGDSLVDYYVKGDFRSKELTIHKVADGSKASAGADKQVAKITKRCNSLSECQFGAQTYFLEIEPGADAAFLTALAIVIDENYSGSLARGHSSQHYATTDSMEPTHAVPISNHNMTRGIPGAATAAHAAAAASGGSCKTSAANGGGNYDSSSARNISVHERYSDDGYFTGHKSQQWEDDESDDDFFYS